MVGADIQDVMYACVKISENKFSKLVLVSHHQEIHWGGHEA